MTVKSKTTKLYSFRLDVELVDRLREKAEKDDLTLTQLVQKYLKAGINGASPEQGQQSLAPDNLGRTALLQALVQLLTAPEIHLPESQSPDLKALTQEIEQLRQKIEQFEQKLIST